MAGCRGIQLMLLATLVGSATARGQGVPTAAQHPEYDQADSVVLEHTPGPFGGPIYRITITRAGDVRYDPRSTAPERAAKTPLTPAAYRILMAYAASSGFVELPDRIMGDKTLCPRVRTDSPTITVVFYLPGRAKRVVDYQGCEAAPAQLRRFEIAIQQAAGVKP